VVQKLPAGHNGFGETIREVSEDKEKFYTYRADGKISGFASGNIQVSYLYDGLDRLVAKLINENGSMYTQSFIHLDRETRVLLGKAGDGTVTTYIDGQGIAERLGEVKGGVGKGYITDHLGSVLNSSVAGSWKSYGLFGEPSFKSTISISGPPVEYGFSGYIFNRESGSYQTKYRQYDSSNGRWLTQDPIGRLSGDSNYYRYSFNRPLIFSDPLGLSPDETEDPFDVLPNPGRWWDEIVQDAKDFCRIGDKKQREERRKKKEKAEQEKKAREEKRKKCEEAKKRARYECGLFGKTTGSCDTAQTEATYACQ